METKMTGDSKYVKVRTCCLCLTANCPDGLLIDNESPWLQTFTFCFGIAMSLNGIQKQLCSKCRDKLIEYSDFKKMALRSDKLWNSVINVNTSIIKLEKSNETQINSDLEVTICYDDDDNLSDNYIIQVGSPDTQDITLLENTIFNMENGITHEAMCYSCGCIFDSEETYTDHLHACVNIDKDLETSKETKHNELDSCEKKLKTLKKRLKKSRMKVTILPKPPTYDCGLCENTFSNVAELQQHLTDHSNKNDLCCMICDFIGRDFADMVTHRLNHLPKGYKHIRRCHLCNKRFCGHILRFQFHYRSEHLKETGGWCSKCNKKFTNPKNWVRHEQFFHENKAPFICDFCDKRFLHRHEIIEHLSWYHYNTYKYLCELCGLGFQKRYTFKVHTQGRHNDQKAKCAHCGRTFKNQMSLKSHMKFVKSKRSFPCEMCPNIYRNPSDLRKHMAWHLDNLTYSCKICGSAYKSTQSLKNHMNKHAGYKNHKCDQCTSSFVTSSQLKIHYSVHTGVRRNKCNHCSKSYHEKKFLLKHIAKCHSVRA